MRADRKKRAEIEYNSPLQYINYRVPKGKVLISSEDREFRLGEVVPIIHDRKRKPLILNIFVDGLSQTVLENHMEMLMPNTYRFFREGMICTNAHTAGDWTFPSIASIVTGQTMANHKMLHSKLLRKSQFIQDFIIRFKIGMFCFLFIQFFLNILKTLVIIPQK